jgi:hypothetical protein
VPRGLRAAALAVCLLALPLGPACRAKDKSAERAPAAKETRMLENADYPRIAMLWAPLRGTEWDSLEDWARHDLVMVSAGQLGLEPDSEPRALADGFTPASIENTRSRIARLREINPKIVVLCDLSFFELEEDALPEDHPWWLRVDGKREQFWPGTYRLDWHNKDYQRHILRKAVAVRDLGVDGVFYDNLRDEPEALIPILEGIRKAVGDDFLIMANVGYAIDEYDWAAAYLNGMMYESGWSHRRTEWDECIEAMRRTASLLREPRVSLIERFEEVRGHAGWPTDRRRRQTPPRDPAARRWSLCYSLIVGDYYYLFSDNTSHRHDWYPEYDAKIGLPAGVGERISAHVWQREYDKGLVVVNLPGADGAHVMELERPACDSFSGERGVKFTVAPGDGAILMRER